MKQKLTIDTFREMGYMVAVHNDYFQNNKKHTFWLLSHPNGLWIKGEGETDAEAFVALERNHLLRVMEGNDKVDRLFADIKSRSGFTGFGDLDEAVVEEIRRTWTSIIMGEGDWE